VESIKNPLGKEVNLSSEKTPLQKVGDFLREGRQARNLSTEALSKQLRIGEEQLIAIENGEEEALPEKVFIKAMVRRISEKLNLDTSFILEEFNNRVPKRKEIYSPKTSKTTSKKNDFKKVPVMIALSGLLGLISSFYLINYLSSQMPQTIEETNRSLD
tara:strand:- start:3339 stop:3815 length:477 start_codon:yes stop_codon:yes gene_type:complete